MPRAFASRKDDVARAVSRCSAQLALSRPGRNVLPVPRALVTGASRGLGRETCRQLLRAGFDVLVAARSGADAERVAHELGPSATPVELDVTNETSVQRLARELAGSEPLAALVNNAGIALDGFDARVARETLSVNFHGAVRVTDALTPLLAPNASVVMVSSGMGELSAVSAELRSALLDPALERETLNQLVARLTDGLQRGGDLGGWPRSAYRVSKAALNAFTRILAREWQGSERRVNAVCPGWVRTDMGGQGASRSVEHGARGIVWAALGADGQSGGFFRDGRAIEW